MQMIELQVVKYSSDFKPCKVGLTPEQDVGPLLDLLKAFARQANNELRVARI